jgi:hypothetical protein
MLTTTQSTGLRLGEGQKEPDLNFFLHPDYGVAIGESFRDGQGKT